MRIAICDDEPKILDILFDKTRDELAKENKDADISLFSDPQKLLSKFREDPAAYDILFLDIRMDGLNGIKLAEEIRQLGSHVLLIFLTSSAEYVFRGYEVKAFRYLMKNELDFGFAKVLRDTIDELEHHEEDRFTFQFGTETISLELRHIYYFESKKRIVNIQLSDSSYKTYAKLDDIETALTGKDFIRCHQSFLVNAKKILRLSAGELILKNSVVIPVSKKYRKSVNDAYLWSLR